MPTRNHIQIAYCMTKAAHFVPCNRCKVHITISLLRGVQKKIIWCYSTRKECCSCIPHPVEGSEGIKASWCPSAVATNHLICQYTGWELYFMSCGTPGGGGTPGAAVPYAGPPGYGTYATAMASFCTTQLVQIPYNMIEGQGSAVSLAVQGRQEEC